MPALPAWRVRSQACLHGLEPARAVWAVGTRPGSGPRNNEHCWAHKESVEQLGELGGPDDEGGLL
jgi:hypothetical protein